MILPSPPKEYNQSIEVRRNSEIDREDQRNLKRGADVEFGARGGAEALYIYSPNGSRWKITVSNLGALSAVAA